MFCEQETGGGVNSPRVFVSCKLANHDPGLLHPMAPLSAQVHADQPPSKQEAMEVSVQSTGTISLGRFCIKTYDITVAQKSVPMFACFSLKSITPNCI